MSHKDQQSAARKLLIAGAAALTLIAAVPGSSSAEPRKSIAEVRKQVERLYHEAERVTERANELEEKMAAIDRRARNLSRDVDRQQRKLAALRAKIGGLAAAEYRSGAMDTTVQLLAADNPEDFLAQVSTTKALTVRQGDLLRQMQAEQNRLTEQKRARDGALARYRKTAAVTAARKKNVEGKAAKAKALLERLTAEQRRRLEAAERADRGDERIPPPPAGSGRGATALAFAREQLGEPYVFGAAGPSSWDCSGLTMRAWQQSGVSLPHSARQQYEISPKVDKSDLQPGDIVFFYDDLSHNGLYAGNGMVLHAPRPGKSVEYIPIDYMPYYGAGRPG